MQCSTHVMIYSLKTKNYRYANFVITCGAASNKKVGIMITLHFECFIVQYGSNDSFYSAISE